MRLCDIWEERITTDTTAVEQGEERLIASEESLQERLRFETLLFNLSARFMATPFDKVDSEIDNALRQIKEFFQVALCGLLEVHEDKAVVRVSHAVYGEGIEHVSGEINLVELYPWTYERLMQGEYVAINEVEDYPDEALRDRESFAATGTGSRLAIPVAVGGRISRIITIHQAERRRTWPEEYIPRLRLLGEILVNALERRRDGLQLEEQLRFEMLLAEISGRFINLSADRVDGEIEDAQRRVCECLGLDLSSLWQWSTETPHIASMTHIYRPLGGPPLPEPMHARDHFPWCQKQLEAGKIVVVSSVEDVPAEAARDQEVWRQLGIKTTLTFPLSPGGGPIIGALSFNTMQHERTWPGPLVQRLQLVAQMFTNALIRKRDETALRESETRLSLTTDAVGAGLWIMDVDTRRVWVSPQTRELFHFAPDEQVDYERYVKVIHPDDRERVHRDVEHVLRSGENLQCDFRILLPDGNIRWILARGQRFVKSTGEPDRLMGLSFDITERKGMELQLGESQTLLTSLVNSTSDMIWSVDSEHFGLLTFNRGLAEYFLHDHGIHLKTGMSPEDLLPADFARQWHAFYRQAIAQGTFTTEYSTSGGNRVLRLNVNSLKSTEGVYGVSVFAQDITGRKKLEKQLKEQLSEIETLKQRLQRDNIYLQEEIKLLAEHTGIVGQSHIMRKVLEQARQVALTDSTVLLLGETGTGKELLARAIHQMSDKKARPLITVNCASLPPTLIESELFGRERGAYTGAMTRMIGRFEIADGSTLFLDEIGELPLELQGKLLRVIEEGIFERLGSTKPIHVNVRIIAATNRDIEQEVRNRKFRQDLYYRLNVFPIVIRPLRERPEDIPLLVWAFVNEFQKRMGKTIESVSRASLEALQSYSWPGNVRELRNVIERAMILNRSKILVVQPPRFQSLRPETPRDLEDMERRHIIGVLESTGWRVSGKGGAAEVLGLKRSTLVSKMTKLGISRPSS